MDIKIIALDLDGTTMHTGGYLSRYNKKAIERAIEKGVEVVAASGRAFTALPEDIKNIKGIKYAITSNGAYIRDLENEINIYSKFLSIIAVRKVIEIAKNEQINIEAFCGGQAYTDAALYEEVKKNGSLHRNRDYVLRTRKPLNDIFGFMQKHENEIENVNFFFENMKRREEMKDVIYAIPEATITSSLPNNIEVGGIGVSKSSALKVLIDKLHISNKNLMCCGDAPNDIAMLEYAEIGVAMGNAWDEVKTHADYVTDTNDNDGVGKAIHKFVLDL